MKKEQEDIYREALERFKRAYDADSENCKKAKADIEFAFVEGEQWDAKAKKARGDYRPMYEFNRVRQAIRQVVGDQRRERPSGKVRGVDSATDQDFAETITGLIRNIESVSGAEKAYDMAYEFAVAGGKGAWRICTDYAGDTAFEQDIRIKEIPNPFAVYFDPAAQEFDRRDGLFAFVCERIPEAEFERKYPEADLKGWEGNDSHALWMEDGTIQVAEYWRKVPETRTILLMSDGTTLDEDDVESIKDELAAAGVNVVKSREVEGYKVEQYILGGGGVVEGPNEYPGKFIPIVPCWGDLMNIDGEWRYSGLVRFAKDAQRIHNYQLTTAIEAVALTPKAPYLVTPAQIKGLESVWAGANAENLPYITYNPDPQAPGGIPQRQPPPAVPQSQLALAQISGDELKATTGIYDASLGARSNETSGKAILARQNEGDTANYAYIDNLGRALSFTWEILLDLIPRIYDTKRTIRILGEDGAEKWATLNETVLDQQTGQEVVKYDLGKAKFDVAFTVGPTFQTARMELADSLMGLSQANPQVGLMLSDLVVRNLDMPGSDEVAKRIRWFLEKNGMVPPEAQDGQPEIPPQVQGMIAQGKQILDAQAQAIQQLQGELQQAGAEIQRLKVGEETKQADTVIKAQELELKRQELMLKLKELEDKHAIEVGKLRIDAFEAERNAAVEAATVATQQAGEGMGKMQAEIGQALAALQGQIQEVHAKAVAPRVKRTNATRVGDGQWAVETVEVPAE